MDYVEVFTNNFLQDVASLERKTGLDDDDNKDVDGSSDDEDIKNKIIKCMKAFEEKHMKKVQNRHVYRKHMEEEIISKLHFKDGSNKYIYLLNHIDVLEYFLNQSSHRVHIAMYDVVVILLCGYVDWVVDCLRIKPKVIKKLLLVLMADDKTGGNDGDDEDDNDGDDSGSGAENGGKGESTTVLTKIKNDLTVFIGYDKGSINWSNRLKSFHKMYKLEKMQKLFNDNLFENRHVIFKNRMSVNNVLFLENMMCSTINNTPYLEYLSKKTCRSFLRLNTLLIFLFVVCDDIYDLQEDLAEQSKTYFTCLHKNLSKNKYNTHTHYLILFMLEELINSLYISGVEGEIVKSVENIKFMFRNHDFM